jgi:hypothetical protein
MQWMYILPAVLLFNMAAAAPPEQQDEQQQGQGQGQARDKSGPRH